MIVRVLHIIGSMSQGGAENFLMNLYRTIDKNKIQFDFLVNRDGSFDNEIKSLGGNVYKIPSLQSIGRIKYVKELDDFLNSHRNNNYIIHSHINQVSGLILKRAYMSGYATRIAHGHGSAYSNNIFVTLYKIPLGKMIPKYATHMFGCSKEATKHLFGKYSNNAYVIPNGIDYRKYSYSEQNRNYIRKKYGINDETIIIGNVSTFKYEKNHMFIIDIFSEYIKINNNAILMLVGDGQLRKKIENKIRMLGLDDHVILTGTQNNSNEYYSAFDVFLFPSVNEGLPLSMIEAQVSGLHCLTSIEGVSSECKISSETDFISLKKDKIYWAQHIRKNENRKEINIDRKYDVNILVEKMSRFYLNGETEVLKNDDKN